MAVWNRRRVSTWPESARLLERRYLAGEGVPFHRAALLAVPLGDVQRAESPEPGTAEREFLPAAGAQRRDRRGPPSWLLFRPHHEHSDRPAVDAVRPEILFLKRG